MFCHNFQQDSMDLEFHYSMKHEKAYIEFENWRKLTSSLTDLIRKFSSLLRRKKKFNQKKTKTTIKTETENIHKNVLNTLQNRLNENQLRLNSINCEKAVLSWLTSYPLRNHEFDLAKQQFWDSLRPRCYWVLPNMPSTCCYSAKIDAQNGMGCKRGGFVTIRHNNAKRYCKPAQQRVQ